MITLMIIVTVAGIESTEKAHFNEGERMPSRSGIKKRRTRNLYDFASTL